MSSPEPMGLGLARLFVALIIWFLCLQHVEALHVPRGVSQHSISKADKFTSLPVTDYSVRSNKRPDWPAVYAASLARWNRRVPDVLKRHLERRDTPRNDDDEETSRNPVFIILIHRFDAIIEEADNGEPKSGSLASPCKDRRHGFPIRNHHRDNGGAYSRAL